MDRIIKMKSALLGVAIFGCLSLGAMEKEANTMAMELQKSNNYCWLQNTLFAAKAMKAAGMPHEVAAIIVGNSYALRKAEVYQKFDSFFCFDNESYHKMYSEYGSFIRNLARKDYADVLRGIDKTCRKFDDLKVSHFLFFTENQDVTLSALLSQKCFFQARGGRPCVVALYQEYKQLETLTPIFRSLPAALVDSADDKQKYRHAQRGYVSDEENDSDDDLSESVCRGDYFSDGSHWDFRCAQSEDSLVERLSDDYLLELLSEVGK